RAWLKKVLNETVRGGGYDAPVRVERLLKQGGPGAVLAEISALQSDYVKRVYFDELLKQGSLDPGTARVALQQAAREIASDYEKSQVLTKIARQYVNDDSMRAVYIDAVNTMHSDYEKGRALGAVLQADNLSRESVLFALKSIASVSSDYE